MKKMAPCSHWRMVNGIRHHVLEFSRDGAATVLLCHGWLDMSWSWFQLAEILVEAGYRVVAFDWRGHGESEWIAPGATYHFVDYAADLAALWPQLVTGPCHLVAHSMGGTAAVMFCGATLATQASALPTLQTLSLLEGLGPRSGPPADPAVHLQRWFNAHARPLPLRAQRVAHLAAAQDRLQRNHPKADTAWLRFVAERSTRPCHPTPQRCWRFDPRHRLVGATPFCSTRFRAFASHINRPTLVLSGQCGMQLADATARANALPNRSFAQVAEAGHMLHWTHAQALASALQAFWHNHAGGLAGPA